jgi:hypothetical protein
MYIITNHTNQPLRIIGQLLLPRQSTKMSELTPQIKNMEHKGLITIKEQKL